jgi:CrcB protein
VNARRLLVPAAVLAGGLLGSGTRAGISLRFPTAAGTFPTSTFLVNLTGSLLLGLYLARRQRAVTARSSVQFWAIGALGSFTTFSAFSVETFQLVDAGSNALAAMYATASLLGGLTAALLGDRLGSVGR